MAVNNKFLKSGFSISVEPTFNIKITIKLYSTISPLRASCAFFCQTNTAATIHVPTTPRLIMVPMPIKLQSTKPGKTADLPSLLQEIDNSIKAKITIKIPFQRKNSIEKYKLLQ